jgi:hypothetical protein
MAFDSPEVLISYSHDSAEHTRRVRALADRLRADGVETWIDQYTQDPNEGWIRWMRQKVKQADKVLLAFTGTYQRRFEGEEEEGKGLGATFEGVIVTQALSVAPISGWSYSQPRFAWPLRSVMNNSEMISAAIRPSLPGTSPRFLIQTLLVSPNLPLREIRDREVLLPQDGPCFVITPRSFPGMSPRWGAPGPAPFPKSRFLVYDLSAIDTGAKRRQRDSSDSTSSLSLAHWTKPGALSAKTPKIRLASS